jgi:hypothetical protein
MTFALLIAMHTAKLYLAQARDAKANGRPVATAFYVRKARATVREARRGTINIGLRVLYGGQLG